MEGNSYGLWKKTSKQGNNYYGGTITLGNDKYSIRVFKNTSKSEDKQPDLKMFVDKIEKEEKPKENPLADQVFADFGNEIEITDKDLPF